MYPFTPKGLCKVFYDAFGYNLVSGLFDGCSLQYTPFMLSQTKPFLFRSMNKYVVPIEFAAEEDLRVVLDRARRSLGVPEDYLVLRIETRKKGNGMEPFLEYLACEYFKKRGYVVENQIPLAHGIGSPDFGGYILNETTKMLSDRKVLPCGFHVIELAMMRTCPGGYAPMLSPPASCIVGEAKTSAQVMTTQLRKYLDTGLYEFGLEICTSKQKPSEAFLGLLTIDKSYHVRYLAPTLHYDAKCPLSCNDYHAWLNNYIKYYVLANLSDEEFRNFYLRLVGRALSTQDDIVQFVNAQPLGTDLPPTIVPLVEL